MSHDTWIEAAALDDLWDGAGLAVDAAGRDLALFRLGDEVLALDNLCTHGNARLCDGFVEDGQVECPLHQGRFDLRTGAPTCEPVTDPVRTWPVRIEGGRVFVQVG
jgi:naphthalene 1,2-dioxygenase system ferredoxin subunit